MTTRANVRAQLTQAIEIVVGRIASGLIPELRDATPKDTQYHASRWVGRVGGPPASRTTPPTRSGRAAALSFGQQQASIASLRTFRISQGRIFVSNDGNYIEQLNAREGNFVQRAVISAVRGVSLAGTSLRR